MKTLILVLAVMLGLSSATCTSEEAIAAIDNSAPAGESLLAIKALVTQAVREMDSDNKNWAYTQTTRSKDKIRIERYVPNVALEQQWTLLSVNGENPNEEQRKSYLVDKAKQRQRNEEAKVAEAKKTADIAKNGKSAEQRVTVRSSDMVDQNSLQLLSENDQEWVLSFQPKIPDFDTELNQRIAGRLHLTKQGHFISAMTLDNTDTLSPFFAVTIKAFHMNMAFTKLADNSLVPTRITSLINGRAFLVKSIDEDSEQSFSDYRYIMPVLAQ